MLSINKICGAESSYINQNKISFQSRFVPNAALKEAFNIAKSDKICDDFSRYFARVIDFALNDGKDDLIKVSKSAKGSITLMINGKRVDRHLITKYSVCEDGGLAMRTIIGYFVNKNEVDLSKLTKQEFDLVEPLMGDLVCKAIKDLLSGNLCIYRNLENNVFNIKNILFKNTEKTLNKLETKIFNK